MYLLIVFLPLLGSSVAGFFGRFLGSEGTAIMTTTCVSFSSILSLIAFYEVAGLFYPLYGYLHSICSIFKWCYTISVADNISVT